jgi:microcystin-dependent protein
VDVYIGTIELFAFNFAPLDWMCCDGRPLSCDLYPELFAQIGYTFGSNGSVFFFRICWDWSHYLI